MLKNVVQFHPRTGRECPIFHLMGYCLGGTLATIFTALYPSVVKDLVLMSAPIDLGGENSLSEGLGQPANVSTSTHSSMRSEIVRAPSCGRCFALLDPVRNSLRQISVTWRAECTMRSSSKASWRCSNGQTLRSRSPASVFRDVVELLYQRNLLARGQLVIDGGPVRLDRITCAVLLLTATADRLVTPQSTLGLVPLDLLARRQEYVAGGRA